MRQINQFRDWIFTKVHHQNLVYNTCWEDPRCDRQLLDLQSDSKMVMITSAGCNALDYLLDHPAEINCIDVNPRQNALLELKRVIFQNSDYQQLFETFGKGNNPAMPDLYYDVLHKTLPDYAKYFWNEHLDFFTKKGRRNSFYHFGTSGVFAYLAQRYMQMKGNLYEEVLQLLKAEDLTQQEAIYNRIEAQFSNAFMEWLINRHFTMCLLGVPRSQQELFKKRYREGALGFLKNCLRRVFTQLSVHDNYFYRLYITGSYTKDCCPEYLNPTNFDTLKVNTERLNLHTTTISGFLKKNPASYSHYVLLDHQDWLAANQQEALEEEWNLILKNSHSGTKILLRSAAENVDFFPDFVKDKVIFEQEKTKKTHTEDRVGTYASVYLLEVK